MLDAQCSMLDAQCSMLDILNQFLPDILCLASIVLKMCIQKVWKEKNAQYDKNNKELYQHQYPQGPANSHPPEAVAVKGK